MGRWAAGEIVDRAWAELEARRLEAEAAFAQFDTEGGTEGYLSLEEVKRLLRVKGVAISAEKVIQDFERQEFGADFRPSHEADKAISAGEYPAFMDFVAKVAEMPDSGNELYYDTETGMWKIYE